MYSVSSSVFIFFSHFFYILKQKESKNSQQTNSMQLHNTCSKQRYIFKNNYIFARFLALLITIETINKAPRRVVKRRDVLIESSVRKRETAKNPRVLS